MKKTLTVIVLGFLMFQQTALAAGGVIVEDPGSIAKTVEVIQKAKAQIDELKKQVDLAKNQLDAYKQEVLDTKKRLEGVSDYSAMFGSADAYLKDFWNDLNKDLTDSDVRNLASKYGFDTKEYEQIKQQYKEKFEQVTKYEALSKDLEKSADKLAKAQKEFNQATTPQKREELQNNIMLENSTMQLKIAQAEAEIRRSEKEQKLREEAALRKYMDSNFS
ncbi:TPA: type IV secretion system protein [Salmonella enterica subsp. enterica serovar Saintpaul]